MAKLKDVCNFFVELSNDNGIEITNLKLNKLLYFAQGLHLSKYGKNLFDEDFQAWQHGPVIPLAYRQYKSFGNSNISNGSPVDVDCFSTEEYGTLLLTMSEFGEKSTSQLVEITHRANSPWSKHSANSIISKSEIESYFKENFSHVQLDLTGIKIVVPKIDKDGVLVVPYEEGDDDWEF